jgi:RNA polymerase sigma-70 factor (ECF subfamily)
MGEVRAGGVGVESEFFERLYAQHFDRVAAYLLARTDRDTAADVLAGTFETAWRRIADVPDEPLPWLLGVARRVLANARRSSSRQVALVDRIGQATSASSSDPAGESAISASLLEAISSLTPSQQEALLLVAWDGLSEREAALALGCTRVAFAARVHRARSRFRTALTNDETWRDRHAPGEPARPLPKANPAEEAR